MDENQIKEWMNVFVAEVDEQLQIMDEEILNLEQTGESDENIQRLFRAAHTLKGSSAAMGFEEMNKLTHQMEHVLDCLRNKQLSISSNMINVLFKCLDQLKLLKEEFVSGHGISIDILNVIIELQQITEKPDIVVDSDENPDEEVCFDKSSNRELKWKVKEALEQDYRIFIVKINISPECMMKSARAYVVLNTISAWGNILHTCPSIDLTEMEDDMRLETVQFLLQTKIEELNPDRLYMMDITKVEIVPFSKESLNLSELDVSIENIEKDKPVSKVEENEKTRQKSKMIRVHVDRLDDLMNLVGELVIDQTRLNQVGGKLNQKYTSDIEVEDLRQISDHVTRVIGDLQESVMMIRMLPIEQLFNRFPRMIRDLTQSLDKEVELIIEGNETELDRTVIEEIGDPLIHLIRNAIDHGIESREERIKKGKEPKGKLIISAKNEENQIILTVEDDGAGIDSVKVRESAIQKGLITEEHAAGLSEHELIQLIFMPGFSTASEISDISGRGVGMDIVREHIEKLNGVIDIETKLEKGTHFRIKLPLTLAILTGLLVSVSKRTYIIPMSNVSEIVRISSKDIQFIRGEKVIVIREQIIPIIWLKEYFDLPSNENSRKNLQVVIVGTAEKRMAIVVDELIGNQEIVVKSLGTFLGKVNNISGGAILGDGSVALILEVAGFFYETK